MKRSSQSPVGSHARTSREPCGNFEDVPSEIYGPREVNHGSLCVIKVAVKLEIHERAFASNPLADGTDLDKVD